MRLKSSILFQLLAGGFAATTLVMAAGGAASYYLVKRSWIEQVDRSLETASFRQDQPQRDSQRFGQEYRDAKHRLQEVRGRFLIVWCGAEVLLSGLLLLLVRTSLEPLRHLSEAFQRERNLLADLAHELRTPLAGIRTTLEVGLDDNEAEARLAMRQSLSIAVGMQSLMESLMAIARLDGGQILPDLVEIDLATTLEDLWRPHAADAKRRGSKAILGLNPGLTVFADREWLAVVVRNLLENAFNHAGRKGWVECTATVEGASVVLCVRNDGCRLEPSEAVHVFDRFWRGDPARSLGTGHAGLGLSLCKELVLHMRGSIEAKVPETGVFQVNLALPSA